MKNDQSRILEIQKKFFKSGILNDIVYRKNALIKLEREIKKNEINIHKALYEDLGKSH